MRILGKPTLPCGHQRVNEPEEGRTIRCRTCRKKWVLILVPLHQHVLEMLKEDVRRVTFEEVQKKTSTDTTSSEMP